MKRIGLTLMAILLVACPLFSQYAIISETKIAFASNRDGNFEIYIMNADGSNQTNLTSDPANDEYPSWSPDGKRIAYSSMKKLNTDVYIINADGSGRIRLTDNPAFEAFPSWSPDGKKIAFTSERDGNVDIYIMNADGSNQTRLTDNPAADVKPQWSPDGKKIAFYSLRNDVPPKKDERQWWYEMNAEIYIMNADGSEQKNITNNPAYDGYPSWSPLSLDVE